MIFPIDHVHEGIRHRIKDREKAEIFQAVCSAGAITRKEISLAVGARPTTVSNVVHELILDRLVSEGEVKEPGRQGRPEILLHPRLDRLVALGLYVVSREIKGALIGLDGAILATASAALPADAGNALVVDTISDLGSRLTAMKPVESELLGAGLSLTGSINVSERKWKYTARWRNIEDIDLRLIEKRIGLPVAPIRIITSRLEYLLLERPELRTGGTLLVHWGYGIGAAYALDGRVVRASDGSFAEIGHWKVAQEESRPCLCGGTDCLETAASLWALSPELENRYGKIPEDEVEFASFFNKNGMVRDALVVSARRHVATCMANLFMTLYPDRILVYGPFADSREAYDRVAEEVIKTVPPFVRKQVQLEHLPLEFEGDVIGSTHHLFRIALRTLLTVGEAGERGPGDRDFPKRAVVDFPSGSY